MPNFKLVPDPSEMMGLMGSEALRAFVETLKAHPDQIRSNRNTGMILILLTERLGYTYSTAYRLVYPSRRCSDASAANHVRRLKKHHREKYPMGINEALEVNGVTIEGIVEDIQAERKATKFNWNNQTGKWEPSDVPDYPTRRAARRELREWVNLDQKVRQELAIGKAEMAKMDLNTGQKFDTIAEWNEYMDGRDEELKEERALAAREMKLIAAGRQIIQDVGEKEAKKMRLTALAAGLTGDEPDDE